MKFSRRGFSLVELIFGVVLVGLIVAMGLLQTSRTTEAAETRGLAEEIAEELRAARRLAITSRAPVAVAFPSGAGGSGHARGLYTLEGVHRPKVTGGRRYDGDYPNACAFIGYWPGSISPSNSRARLPFSGNDAGFDIADWEVPFPQDYLFVFTPSGHLVTNGLTHYGGEYHILVSEGIAYSPAAAPPGASTFPISYFQPSEVSSPYTICLSAAGAVSVVPGVPGSATLAGSRGRIETAAPPALPSPASGNSPPVLVQAVPDPQSVSLPTGASAVIPKEGYLSLRLEVTEPDGQIPRAFWTASAGTLSSTVPTLMEWDPVKRSWSSVWVWTPPPGAIEGAQYEIEYQVDDGQGGVITGSLGANGQAQVGISGQIAFTTMRNNGYYEMAAISPDGSNMRLITPEGDQHENFYGSWAPGRNQLACYGWDVNDVDIWESLYVVNGDGSNLVTVHELDWTDDKTFQPYDYWYNIIGPAWSPQGTRIAYSISDDSDFSGEIWRVNSDGSGRLQLTNPAADVVDYNPCWNNNGTEIIFHRERWNSADNCDIMKINVSGTGLTNLTNASTSVYNYDPSYSPDGSNIVYVRESPSSTQLRLMDSNGAQFAGNPLLDSFWPGTPRFSPNGALIAFIDSDLYVTTTTGLNPDTGVAGAKKISTSGWVTDYCWSPDSGRIVYSDGFVLHQANVMGSVSERQVSPIESTEDWIPSWGQ